MNTPYPLEGGSRVVYRWRDGGGTRLFTLSLKGDERRCGAVFPADAGIRGWQIVFAVTVWNGAGHPPSSPFEGGVF